MGGGTGSFESKTEVPSVGIFSESTVDSPDSSNLQGKSKKGSSHREFDSRVIASSKKIAEIKVKNSFHCTVNILMTFNCRNVK